MIDKPFAAYTGDEPFVFTSYSHVDAELIYPQLEWIHQKGFRVWFDEGISPGHSWTADIAQAIEDCSLFVLFVTPAAVESEHCINEVQFALGRHKPFLAIHLQETILPAHLELSIGNRQAILAHQLSSTEYQQKAIDALTALFAEGPMTSVNAQRQSAVVASHPVRRRTRLSTAAAAAFALLIAGGVWWWLLPLKTEQPSIAVLPLINYTQTVVYRPSATTSTSARS